MATVNRDGQIAEFELGAFDGFKFQLGHKTMGDEEFVVVRRILVQAANGKTGRCYDLAVGGENYFKAIEIELEADDGDES